MPIRTRFVNISRLLIAGDVVKLLRELVGCVKQLYDQFAGSRAQGIYEVLEHDTTLELRDSRGQVATVQRQQKVRFLQDNVVAFADYAWGDGEIFAEYRCSPGVPVDKYSQGSRHTVLVSLRETKSRGDVLRFTIDRKILGGFTKRSEWWETEVYHRTRHLKVAIIFPAGRHCQRATITQRSTNKTTTLGPQHFQFLTDGRQTLTWETAKPKLHDRYVLKWRW